MPSASIFRRPPSNWENRDGNSKKNYYRQISHLSEALGDELQGPVDLRRVQQVGLLFKKSKFQHFLKFAL